MPLFRDAEVPPLILRRRPAYFVLYSALLCLSLTITLALPLVARSACTVCGSLLTFANAVFFATALWEGVRSTVVLDGQAISCGDVRIRWPAVERVRLGSRICVVYGEDGERIAFNHLYESYDEAVLRIQRLEASHEDA